MYLYVWDHICLYMHVEAQGCCWNLSGLFFYLILWGRSITQIQSSPTSLVSLASSLRDPLFSPSRAWLTQGLPRPPTCQWAPGIWTPVLVFVQCFDCWIIDTALLPPFPTLPWDKSSIRNEVLFGSWFWVIVQHCGKVKARHVTFAVKSRGQGTHTFLVVWAPFLLLI